jgi:prepilin peptidase CpaA
MAVGLLSLTLSAGALVWSAASDICTYEIPNAASIIILGGFVCFSFCGPTQALLYQVLIGAGLFIGGALLFVRGLLGGGDVKLLAATSLWCSPHLLAPFAIVVGGAGAALAALMLTPARRFMPPAPQEAVAAAGSCEGLRQPMPFGVAISLGGLWLLAQHIASLG